MADRAEAAGVAVAVVGHIVLFGALSIGLIAVPKPMPPTTSPVDVTLVDAVALRDATPSPARDEPAPSVAPEVGLPEPTQPPPPPIEPLPAPAPAPSKPAPVRHPPSPSAVQRPVPPAKFPAPKPTVPKVGAARPTAAPPASNRPRLALNLARPGATPPRGARLGNDFLKGVSERPTKGTAQAPRAANDGALQVSLGRALLQQLRPFWQSAVPSGADVELLRTTVDVRLHRDGSVASVRVVDTTGQTASNRNQVRLHQEAAVKAVRLAAPFVFPSEQYDAWQFLQPTLDKRMLR